MELPNVNDSLDENDKGNLIMELCDKNNSIIEKGKPIMFRRKIKTKRRKIPFIIFPMLLILLITIISGIIYLIISSKYEITYNVLENAYTKPKYSNHNYTSITFENGLKLVLVQVDTNDSAGGAISFDYGYLDNKYNPGYI